MRPNPMTPRSLPRNSMPVKRFLSHAPCFIDASAAGMPRASAIISPSVSSATLMLFAPAAFNTRTPRPLAAARSTLSTPVPARAITRSLDAASSREAVTCVALRTISASACSRSRARSAGDRPLRASTVHPRSRNGDAALSGRLSAITMCMSLCIMTCSTRWHAPSWCKPLETSD